MLDFQLVKSRISIEMGASYLGLELKPEGAQFRTACPHCKQGGDRALVVTPGRDLFYCFAAQRGGDVISLVSHVHQVPLPKAAQELVERYGLDDAPPQQARPSPVPPVQPQPPAETPQEDGLKPLEHLDHKHEAVAALGFTAKDAEAIGLGHTSKGLMKGLVALPIRVNGKLVGYVGIPPGTKLKLPKTWKLA
jgi:CHC2 zinc finger